MWCENQMRGLWTVDQVHLHAGYRWTWWDRMIIWLWDERYSNRCPSSRTRWRRWDGTHGVTGGVLEFYFFQVQVHTQAVHVHPGDGMPVVRWDSEILKFLTRLTYLLEIVEEDGIELEASESKIIRWGVLVFKHATTFTYWLEMDEADGMIRCQWVVFKRLTKFTNSQLQPASKTIGLGWSDGAPRGVFKHVTKFTYLLKTDEEKRYDAEMSEMSRI